jgi:hypothetical protein
MQPIDPVKSFKAGLPAQQVNIARYGVGRHKFLKNKRVAQ